MKITMRAARVNVGLKQSEAADALNVSLKSIQNWEAGVSSPRADMLPEICALYKCEPGDLKFLASNCS